ncbi:MAG: hypothetical protein H7177_12950 [Rhizobacter sp.]|nr:hypothetical protein [Bacteriovorax sp.]
MVVSKVKKTMFFIMLLTAFNLSAAINPQAMNAQNAQMVNLNLKIKSNNQTVKSDLMMPFYQLASFERKFGSKNVLIEMSPKHGKNADEIALEMRFYKVAGAKAFYKKDIIAKIGEESHVSFRGMSLKVTPVLN